MFWDELVRRWRRDVRAIDPRLLRTAGGHVAALPQPRPRRRIPWRAVVLGIAVAAFMVALAEAFQTVLFLVGQ
jgi:hypothetical protein